MAKFKQGDHVRKKSGSEWKGIVCGWYSTELTPEGYAVESESHKGSVQIYPANALELVGVASDFNRELGIFDYIEMHKEHHRQCPKCTSGDVKFAKHFIDNKEMVSAHCYECEHEEIAPASDTEQLIDEWFNA